MTDQYGLLGYPARHSKSPAMQNAAFAQAGIDANYQIFEVAPDHLTDKFTELLHAGVQGFNVTMPYKTAIMPLLDEITPLAQRLAAVNTVVVQDGRTIGDSTDGPGFWQSLNHTVKTVVIIGTGGAARAIMATAPTGVMLQVFNRYSAQFIDKAAIVAELTGTSLHDLATIDDYLPMADLIINATNVGMQDETAILSTSQLQTTQPTVVVVDIIYKNEPTPLMMAAQAANRQARDGLDMLIGQGALSFEQWRQVKPNIKTMQEALFAKAKEE